MPQRLTGVEALARLREGNRRFVAHVISLESLLSHARRAEHALSQHPFAIVLGCSDSRAPAEFIFDQGLGDLFVIRVAGNIAAASQIGSIEFAVESFGVGLVVVLGHAGCGAIRATVQHCRHPADTSDGLRSIVDYLCPAVLPLVDASAGIDDAVLVERAVRANVVATAQTLRTASSLLEKRVNEGRLLIVGADYNLSTGVVDFFDGMPATSGMASQPW